MKVIQEMGVFLWVDKILSYTFSIYTFAESILPTKTHGYK